MEEATHCSTDSSIASMGIHACFRETQSDQRLIGLRNNWIFRLSLARLRDVTGSVALIAKLLASFVVAAYQGWIRSQQTVVSIFREKTVISSTLFFLSTATAAVNLPTSRLDPILQALRLHVLPVKWFPKQDEPEPEKSVCCEVLYDPTPQPIRADVIFIHGLHGSLFNTWKQGVWHYRGNVRNEAIVHESQQEYLGSVSDVPTCETPEKMVVDTGINEIDPLLENITDIINSIDDKMQGRDAGRVVYCEKDPYSPCWPRDWLPMDCPGVRVIALNYTTDPFLWRPVWITKRIRTCLKERSREMEEHLQAIGVGENPIVWVGHSKGGLFVKQMLVDARKSTGFRHQLLSHTKGIMFYSVPHRGSSLAHINLPLLRQSIELTEVKKDCQEVLSLHKEFLKLYEDKVLSADVFSFVETILTYMFVTNVRVVSVDSADLGFGPFYGVNIDHREICKPLNRDCFLYKELANLINKVV